MVMTFEVLILCFHPRQHRLLKPEKLDLFEIRPSRPVRERFHLGIGEGPPDGETGVMADHGIADEEGRQEPDTEGGEPAAGKVDTCGAEPSDSGHFLQDGEGILLCKMVKGKAAKREIGGLVAEGKLAGVGLDEEHFLGRWRGRARDLQRLELEVDGDDGHIMLAGLRKTDQVAAMVAVTGREVDEQKAARLVGEPVEDGLDGFLAAKGTVQAGEIFEVAAQGVFILIRQIH